MNPDVIQINNITTAKEREKVIQIIISEFHCIFFSKKAQKKNSRQALDFLLGDSVFCSSIDEAIVNLFLDVLQNWVNGQIC